MPTASIGLILAVAAYLTFRKILLPDGECWFIGEFRGPDHCISPAVVWLVYIAAVIFVVAGVARLLNVRQTH